MQNALFPHMEWAKAQAARPLPVPLGWSGALSPPLAALREHGPEEAELVRRIARRYGVSKDHVYLTGGTSLANFIAIAAFSGPGARVVVETPRYACLAEIPRGLGCDVVDLPRTPEGRLDDLPKGGSLLVVTNPHNPTGRILEERDWRKLERFAKRGVVIVDEVYRDLQSRPPKVAAARHRRFITTASFTKCYGLGALRLGWILAAPPLLDRIRRVDNLISVAVSMPSILMALRLWPNLAAYRKRALRHRAGNLARLRASGLRFTPPQAGLTAFVEVGDGDAVAAAAARVGVAVVPGSFLQAPAFVRLFLGAEPQHFRRGLDTLTRILARA
ncbi:MAG: pyridoxal phosphate-dependent aminotransferase [Planctomycetaceae bacterium]